MNKAVGYFLLVLGVALGLLFLVHVLSLVTNVVAWLNGADYMSLVKRVLTVFIVGFFAYKSFIVGKRRISDNPEVETNTWQCISLERPILAEAV